jgi:protein-S-isoprenylcysteine O-methyltransferase Ste14
VDRPGKEALVNERMDLSKGPRVYVPPPLLYVAAFHLAVYLQHLRPLPAARAGGIAVRAAGILFFAAAAFFQFRSLTQFFRTKNTVVTIRPAHSLQTDGIYRISRNPMYVGLALIYLGVACFAGNLWTLLLFPVLLIVVQEFVIKREERYLDAAFGNEYAEYKRRTRRWL